MNLKSLTADRIAQLSPEKRERLKAMLAAKNHPSRGIQPRPKDAELLLSFAQQGMWLLDQMGEMNTVFNLFRTFRLQGRLDQEALAKAIDTIITRHESLRTIIESQDGKPVQKILPSKPYPLETHDLSHLPASDQEAKVLAFCHEENATPIAIATGPLLRIKLLRLSETQHMMLLNMHHMITDAHTSTLLLGELQTLYRAFAQNQPNPLQPIPIQYADYAIWQHQHFSPKRLARERLYWQQKMDGAPPLTGFPCDFSRPAQQPFEGGQVSGRFEEVLNAKLRVFARQAGVTLNTLMLASFKAFLYRYTQQQDLVLGIAVANRDQPGTENIIGFLANQLPIRTQIDPQDNFKDLLARCHNTLLEALAYKDLPFDLILEAIQPDRHPSHTPLFQTIFVFQPMEQTDAQLDTQLSMLPFAFERQIAKTDLTVQMMDRGGQLLYTFDYARALFQHETMMRIARLYMHFIQNLLDAPEARIASLALLDATERQRLISQVGQSKKQPAPATTLHHLFEKTVETFADQPALVFEEQVLTYRELNNQTNRLAHHLIHQFDLKPGKVAAILAHTSTARMVAVLAVLKTGAAYLPMNESQPAARTEYMLEDAQPSVLLTESEFMFELDLEVPVFALDLQFENLPEHHTNPMVASSPDHLAYIIYTSGSTGQPKGVLVPHRGPSILVQYQMQLFNSAYARVLQFASLGFDAAVAEIFATFGMGATLYLAPREALLPGEALLSFFNKHRINHTIMPPALLSQLNPSQLPHIKSILSMGERCGVGLVKKWGPGREFHNGYGPTENSIGAAMYVCDPQEDRDPPLGPPLPHVQSYVLDDHLDLLPQSVAGELYLAGDGLTWGYLNRPALTACVFLPDPYATKPGSRLYKTGDKVTNNPDQTIAFLGRVDFQVKIRGFRIEPEEIDKACTRFAAVEEAVVDVTEDGQNLIAFVVPKANTQPKIDGLPRFELPNGMAITHHSRNQTLYIYEEIFDRRQYDTCGLVFPADAVIFDVGANIGLFSLYASQICPKGRVFSFEPMPPNYNRLVINTGLYGSNVTPFNIALGETEAEVSFAFYPKSSGGSGRYTNQAEEEEVVRTLIRNQEAHDGHLASEANINEIVAGMFEKQDYQVFMRRLSDIVREEGIDRIHLLKIDVEKSEWDVLQGIDPEHFDIIDQIALEVHDIDQRLSKVIHLLEGYGYKITTEQDVLLKGTTLYNLYAIKQPQCQESTHALPQKNAYPPLFSVNALRQHLETTLPGYMVPAYFSVLEKLPLTANGKVDRKALPREHIAVATQEQGRPPQSETECFVATLFTDILEVEVHDVGVHFFSAGGHSLLATQMIARVAEAYDVALPLRALFNNPTLEGFAAHIDQQLLQTGTPKRPPLKPRTEPWANLPLSYAQQRLWVVQQLGGNLPFYHIPLAFKCSGPLQCDALQHAFEVLLERHQVLRSNIHLVQGIPYQNILPVTSFSLTRETAPSPSDQAFQKAWVHQQTQKPFDLQNDLPIRCAVLECDNHQYLIALTLHHLVVDGWSLGSLLWELSTAYTAHLTGQAPELPQLPIQYADYAIWQRNWLEGDALEHQLRFWKQYLEHTPQQLALPWDYKRPQVQSFSGKQIAFRLDQDQYDALLTLSQSHQATLFMTLTAALQILLATYSQQNRFCLGTVVANRDLPELEHLIGFFVNTLALRADVSGNPSFEQLLERVKENANLVFEHQDIPFETVLDHLGLERNTSHAPLFQVMFTLQYASKFSFSLPELTMETLATAHEMTKFDLTIAAVEDAFGLGLVFEYNTQLFKAETIETMGQGFQWLLEEILNHPTAVFDHFATFGTAQDQEVESFQMSEGALPQQTLISLFEERVAASPKAEALVVNQHILSYAELNKNANKLAHLLMQSGVQPGDLVCFWGERSLASLVSLVAIVKAGAAYVPLDPNAPKARHRHLLAKANPKVLLGPTRVKDLYASFLNWEHTERLVTMPETNPGLQLSPEFPAYVLFTSGSTGTPKGVVVSNQAVVSLVMQQTYFEPITAALHTAPLSFDASTFELWATWLHGGRLIVAETPHVSPDYTCQLVSRYHIDTLWLTTGMFNQWVDTIPQVPSSLKQILTGGEQGSKTHFQKAQIQYPHVKLIGCYGPTEATTFASTFCFADHSEKDLYDIPLGRPIHFRGFYILNDQLLQMASGIPGSLFMEGPGLAQGYLHDPGKTAATFLPNPFSQTPGQRIYKTGDMARKAGDQVYFLGRCDQQIKLRGFRIELSEISKTLENHPCVAACRTLLDGIGENRQLIGFWERTPQNHQAIDPRDFLAGQLPSYMVPSRFFEVEQWPLTPNGKVDVKALKAMKQAKNTPAAPPADELERLLQGFWSQVLQSKVEDVHENFFELGGNSLNVVRLQHLLKDAGQKVSLVNLFEHSTIAAQAAFIAVQKPPSLQAQQQRGKSRKQALLRRKTIRPKKEAE